MDEICSTDEDGPKRTTACELLCLVEVLHFDDGLIILVGDELEWPMLQIVLHDRIAVLATDQTLCVEYGVLRVGRHLRLGSFSNESVRVGECDHGGRRSVSKIIGNDLHLSVSPHTDTRVTRR